MTDHKPKYDHATITQAVEALAAARPDIYQACYPRRYPGVRGYPSPAYFALSTLSRTATAVGHPHDKTNLFGFAVSAKLIELGVPTYFVGAELAESLSMTAPPADMSLDELVLPLDAMLFMLPVEFSKKFIGGEVMHLALAKAQKDEKFSVPFKTGLDREPTVAAPSHAALIMSASVLEDGRLVSYHSTTPLGEGKKLSDVIGAPLEYFNGCPPAAGDVEVSAKLLSCALNYALAMMEPTWLAPAVCTRPARTKHGVARDALWSPNFIGKDFRHPTAPGGGTHASPRVHWRHGHWRLQRVGPGRTATRLVLVPAVLVNGGS